MHTLRSLALLIALTCLAAGCGADDPASTSPTEVDPTVGEGPAATEEATTAADPDAAEVDGDADAEADDQPVMPPEPAATPLPEPTGDAPVDEAAGDDSTGAPPPNGDPADAELRLVQIATMDQPIAVTTRPGDDAHLWIAERPGRVRPVTLDGDVGAPVLDLTGATTTESERGLLGIAWAADGQTLFVSSTDTEGATVLQASDVVDGVLQQPRTILRVPQPASNHNGGDVHVGPDGMLWWSLGDGGAADDRFGNGQRPDTLLGTLLRLDPTDQDPSDEPYAIPADNPFASGGDGAPEVWAYGLRNAWRFSFDPATGDVWIADVGQNAIEEVNRAPLGLAGANYGWPRFEGDQRFDGQELAGEHTAPVHTYGHDRGCSITGGVVYRGTDLPALSGAYLYSDFCNGDIYALEVGDDGTIGEDVRTGLAAENVVSFGTTPQGEVIVLSLAGAVLQITPA